MGEKNLVYDVVRNDERIVADKYIARGDAIKLTRRDSQQQYNLSQRQWSGRQTPEFMKSSTI